MGEGLYQEDFVYCLWPLGFVPGLQVLLQLVALKEDFALEDFSLEGFSVNVPFPLLGQLFLLDQLFWLL